MTNNKHVKDPNNGPEIYSWFAKRFPNWTPTKNDDIRYRVTFHWPLPFEHSGGLDIDAGQVLESIFEWAKGVWKKYCLGDEYGDEQAFFHNWGYSSADGGSFSFAICSDLNEALAEVMGNAIMQLLTTKGFTITFRTLY